MMNYEVYDARSLRDSEVRLVYIDTGQDDDSIPCALKQSALSATRDFRVSDNWAGLPK